MYTSVSYSPAPHPQDIMCMQLPHASVSSYDKHKPARPNTSAFLKFVASKITPSIIPMSGQ